MQTSNRFAEYDFNAAFPEESDSSLLPRQSKIRLRRSGGGVREADGGGSSPNPPSAHQSPSSPLPTAHCPLPPLSNDLLEDLLNPSISSLDLCAIHKLSLPALADLLESDQFKLAQSCMRRICTSRTDYVRPEAEALALVRTHDILKDKPTTPAHAETQRKASAYFLPSMSQIRQGRNGGGAEQSGTEGVLQQPFAHPSPLQFPL